MTILQVYSIQMILIWKGFCEQNCLFWKFSFQFKKINSDLIFNAQIFLPNSFQNRGVDNNNLGTPGTRTSSVLPDLLSQASPATPPRLDKSTSDEVRTIFYFILFHILSSSHENSFQLYHFYFILNFHEFFVLFFPFLVLNIFLLSFLCFTL